MNKLKNDFGIMRITLILIIIIAVLFVMIIGLGAYVIVNNNKSDSDDESSKKISSKNSVDTDEDEDEDEDIDDEYDYDDSDSNTTSDYYDNTTSDYDFEIIDDSEQGLQKSSSSLTVHDITVNYNVPNGLTCLNKSTDTSNETYGNANEAFTSENDGLITVSLSYDILCSAEDYLLTHSDHEDYSSEYYTSGIQTTTINGINITYVEFSYVTQKMKTYCSTVCAIYDFGDGHRYMVNYEELSSSDKKVEATLDDISDFFQLTIS